LTNTADIQTGIDEIIVFPNPLTGQLNFSEKVNSSSLYSLAGELLLRQTNTNKIVIDGLANGAYILKIKKGQKSKREKVILIN